MNFDITNFQSLAANLPVEGEVCYLTHAEVSTQTEINTEIAPLIQQVAATSISAIDRLITDLQEVRNHLQSEGERVEREMVRYTKLLILRLPCLPHSFPQGEKGNSINKSG